jgi:pentatricopeptide repeat protein
MNHLRILLVPFTPTSLMLVVVFSLLFAAFDFAGLYGLLATLLAQIWVLKYCYVIVEHIADGASEPPVMSMDMLSPFETRPWVQLGIIIAGTMLCVRIGGTAGMSLGVLFLLLLPASMTILGMGEPAWQAVNPLLLLRVVRGLGPYYLALLAAFFLYGALLLALWRSDVPGFLRHAVLLFCQLSYFGLLGGCVYLRRRQLGHEPRFSPERAAARADAERAKVRDRMVDEVFQQVRLGKHVEATRPLAAWLRELDGDTAAADAHHLVSQALGWGSPAGLNTIASTLIRYLLRAGRPDEALAIFERLRAHSPALTLDSADDLRTLADYAESAGRGELATSMRLETPIYRP